MQPTLPTSSTARAKQQVRNPIIARLYCCNTHQQLMPVTDRTNNDEKHVEEVYACDCIQLQRCIAHKRCQ
jgi:hypothetical protein